MDPVPHNQTKSPWRNFAVSLLLVILLFVSALFSGIYLNSNRALDAELLSRARALYNSITLTRIWAARHGGVYVEKSAGMQSNPYLRNPDKLAVDGTLFTKKNPALMTREISEISEKKGVFGFHITSLDPLNPNNRADDFEQGALQLFEQGEKKEVFAREARGNSSFFRYTAPLYTETACRECHPSSTVGAVRGAISISFNIDETEQAARANRILIICLFLVTLGSFVGIVFRLVGSLKRKLEVAEARIRELMVTDGLTGLRNRRFIDERLEMEFQRARRYRRPLSIVVFDIDFFKKVNDTHGHDSGDEVLRQVATTAQDLCRETDLLGRYGGEEFLLLLPETEIKTAASVADRYRQALEELRIDLRDEKVVRITASFGVACTDFWDASALAADGFSANELFSLADIALYRAKEKGRNRVEVYA